MSDQPSSPLQQALARVDALATQAGEAAQPELAAIRHLLQEAMRNQEGASAQEIENSHAQFISHMVHEVRKPMTSIRGYADMLHKGLIPDPAMQAQFIGTIRNNIISMEGLITDISDYTKMRVGRIKPDKKMDMVKNVLLAVEKAMRPTAEERRHELVFDIPQGLPFLNTDGVRLTQAINKLVDNAIKYTAEGGRIVVSAAPVEGGVEIRVLDNGVGMTPEEIARLGELYFRGDDPLVTNTKGYGFGIPIVMECMRLVEGQLFYESQKGSGSAFWIVMPAMS